MAASNPNRFFVSYIEKQRLLLRALEQLHIEDESPRESAMITEMITELEALCRRSRRRQWNPRTLKLHHFKR